MMRVNTVRLSNRPEFKCYMVTYVFENNASLFAKSFVLRKDALKFAKLKAEFFNAVLVIDLRKG